MANKRAMVIGCKGQDGSYMVDLLNSKGYEVWGISRQDEPHNIKRYAKQVDEIYNFAGKSDVINPFDNVNELEDIWKIPLMVLEQIKDTKVKFFQASSPLMYRPTDTPYAAAKLYADNLVDMYRGQFGTFAVNGIMWPHISERQKDHFFAKKIINAAARKQKITIEHLHAERDWGYAPDYVEAAWLMLQNETPRNYIIGTGRLTSLTRFALMVFDYAKLNLDEYVTVKKLYGIFDPLPKQINGGFDLIYKDLGWVPKTRIEDTIKIMIDHAKVSL